MSKKRVLWTVPLRTFLRKKESFGRRTCGGWMKLKGRVCLVLCAVGLSHLELNHGETVVRDCQPKWSSISETLDVYVIWERSL